MTCRRTVDSPASDVERNDGADECFEAMSHPSRRRILFFLAERSTRGEFGVDALSGGDRAPSPTRLHHVHLPRLHDSGFVEWDAEAETVRRGPRFSDVAPLLRLLRDNRDELPRGVVPHARE